MDSTNLELKIFRLKKGYFAVYMYYVVRPAMVASLLNTMDFIVSLFLK